MFEEVGVGFRCGEVGGGKGEASGRISVGVCVARGARSRRWCGWRGRREC